MFMSAVFRDPAVFRIPRHAKMQSATTEKRQAWTVPLWVCAFSFSVSFLMFSYLFMRLSFSLLLHFILRLTFLSLFYIFLPIVSVSSYFSSLTKSFSYYLSFPSLFRSLIFSFSPVVFSLPLSYFCLFVFPFFHILSLPPSFLPIWKLFCAYVHHPITNIWLNPAMQSLK
jgi:hypothetical protein